MGVSLDKMNGLAIEGAVSMDADVAVGFSWLSLW